MRDWEKNFMRGPFIPEPVGKTAERDIMDVYSVSPFRVRWTDHIIQAVEQAFDTTQAKMKGPRRAREFAYPRFAAMYLIRKYRNISLPQIGRLFGDRDHTTVLSSLRRVKELQRSDLDFVMKLRRAENILSTLSGHEDIDPSKVWPASAIERLKNQVWTETADA